MLVWKIVDQVDNLSWILWKMNSQIYEKVWRKIFSRIFALWILMMIWFLLLFTFKKIMEKTSHDVHSALCYGKVRKPSGFVFSIRIPWFAKWQDLMLHIFSNRTNSKQEKIRIPCRPFAPAVLNHVMSTLPIFRSIGGNWPKKRPSQTCQKRGKLEMIIWRNISHCAHLFCSSLESKKKLVLHKFINMYS